MAADPDVTVVGAGPNGLVAALTLAAAGLSVQVVEKSDTPGGGVRTVALTLPGYRHDVCSTIHPLAAASPFMRDFLDGRTDVELAHPAIPLAHPLDGGRAAVLHSDLHQTAAELHADGARWRQVFGPRTDWVRLSSALLRPISQTALHHSFELGRFGLFAGMPSTVLARLFRSDEARALLGGSAAHSLVPLNRPLTASFALLLNGLGQSVGWPAIRGGSGLLIDAMVHTLTELGGTIECGRAVRSTSDLPGTGLLIFDLTPRQVARIMGDDLPRRTRRQFQRFRYGPGVFKVDYALSEPVPWIHEACRQAGTLHVGGTFDEIALSEAEVGAGRVPERPFVIAAQTSVFDRSRVEGSGETFWAYCHVPNGSTVDMLDRIESQIERFAPGFTDVVLDRHIAGPAWFEDYNESYVGGDIGGGSYGGLQLLARPRLTTDPYGTGNPRVLLCSASTPPGAGVHGMGGYLAAADALKRLGLPPVEAGRLRRSPS